MAFADDILTSLESKQAQQAELQQKLRASLSIADLIPGAFDHGRVTVGGRSTEIAPHKGTITFTLGDGTVVEKPAMEVPWHLWPAGMRGMVAAMRDQRTARKVMIAMGAQHV